MVWRIILVSDQVITLVQKEMRAFRKKLIAALVPKILNKLAKLIAPSKGIKS